jgi:hypothetical protein
MDYKSSLYTAYETLSWKFSLFFKDTVPTKIVGQKIVLEIVRVARDFGHENVAEKQSN